MLPAMHARARALLILVTMTALVWTQSFGGDSSSKQAQPKPSQSVKPTQTNNQQPRLEPQHQTSPNPPAQKRGAVPINVNHDASTARTPLGGSVPTKRPDQPTPSNSQSTQPKYSYGASSSTGYTPLTNTGIPAGTKYSYDAPPSAGYTSMSNAFNSIGTQYSYDAPPGTGYLPLTNTGVPAGTKYSYDAPSSAGYAPVSNIGNTIGTQYSYGASPSTAYTPVSNTGNQVGTKYSYDAPPSTGYTPVQNSSGYTPVQNSGSYAAVPNNGYVTPPAQSAPANARYTPPQSQPAPKSTTTSSLNTASAADAANSLTPFPQAPSAITFEGGAQTPFLGGDVAITYNNSGVKTITTTAGEGLLRFSAYHTSDQNNALCWSPGYDVPGTTANIGLNACFGTDGSSFGASGGIGHLTGSVSVPSQLIFNAYMDSIYGVGNWLGTGLYNASPGSFTGNH